VETVSFDDESTIEVQVSKVAQASVILGVHGSGLSHVLWMPESRAGRSTHLVEMVGYGYGCRNWYETAALAAGVRYHRVMNWRTPANVTNEKLAGCWEHPELCATAECHDLLRDQPIVMEIDTLEAVWRGIVRELDGAEAGVSVG
jgi:capsular polysaccharide biosynthesis protein